MPARVEVIGTDLHLYRPNTGGQTEAWAIRGADAGYDGSYPPGTLYLEAGRIVYYDAAGHKRIIRVSDAGTTARRDGSLAADPAAWLWYAWGGIKRAITHADAAHGDASEHDDVSHADTGYYADKAEEYWDDYTDYSDAPSQLDEHEDYSDQGYADHGDHSDSYSYHTDEGYPGYTDHGDDSHDDWGGYHSDYVDIPHGDYSDSGYEDSGYEDYADHGDGHTDGIDPIYGTYVDSHDDYSDSGYSDSGYTDYADHYDFPHEDFTWTHDDHADAPHYDWSDIWPGSYSDHSDSHADDSDDGGHADSHTDVTGHDDAPASHIDNPHGDSHDDVTDPPYEDYADHGDWHGDYSDTGYEDHHYFSVYLPHADHDDHSDSGHLDYTDHSDAPHADNPRFLGYV